MTAPLRDRFGVIHHLEFYTEEELANIILHSSKVLNVEVDPQGALEMARRSRGTPRLANRILKRVRDFAQVKYDGRITKEVASFALDLLEVDRYGLDQTDRLLLTTIMEKFQGRSGGTRYPGSIDWRRCRHHRRCLRAVPDQIRIYQPHSARKSGNGNLPGTTWGWRHRVRSKSKSPESFISVAFCRKRLFSSIFGI